MAFVRLMTQTDAPVSSFALDKAQIVIGRGHDVDLPVDDAAVSRQHAMLVASPGGAYLVVSLPGADGVWIDGERYESRQLHDGDVFTIGNTDLQYCEGDPRSAATMHLPRQDDGAPPRDPQPAHPEPEPPVRDERRRRRKRRRRRSTPEPIERKSRTWIGLLVFFVLLAGGGFALWWFVLRAPRELPPVPPSVQPQGSNLFELDTTTKVFDLPITGGGRHTLEGVLSDPDGRREIIHRDPKGTEREVVFDSGWNLPAAGVVMDDGTVVVCGNRLTGSPTELTKGNMPDPRGGVELRCRRRVGTEWTGTVVLDHGHGANWLIDTRVRDGKVFVTYSHDELGMLIGAPTVGDGQYVVTFERGGFSAPELVKRFDPPITEYPAP